MSEEFELHGQHDHAVEHAAHIDSLGRQVAMFTAILATIGAIISYQNSGSESLGLELKNEAILKKSEATIEPRVNTDLLQEPAEKALATALSSVKPKADAAFEAGDYTASLQALAALKAPVDAFFDNVMVNADDPALKANRLGLLATLHQAMNRVADLSKLAS